MEEYTVDTVSSSLSRVLVMTRHRKGEKEGSADSVSVSGVAGSVETTLYLYGAGLISEKRGSTILYHHYNHLGSTMQLTDGSGTVKAAYTYGTYGELLSGDTSLTRYLYNGRCGVSTDANGLYYMRQRYYNPEIKRFVNQDVVRGSIGNSRSLNRYSYVQGNPVSYTDPFGLSPISGLFADTSFAHSVLGLLGCIPGPVGILANSADAILYFAVDHDYLMATVSALDAVSMGATGKIAKAVGKGQKISKSAMYLKVTTSLLSNTLSFAKNTSMAGENLHKMYNKYIAGGHTFDWNDSETRAECYNLCLNLFGMALSGSGMSRDTSKLSRMLEADGVERALRNKISNVLSGGRKSGSGSLNEEIFTRYMPDGRQVTYVTNLPGSTGIKTPRRLTTEEMTFLTQEYGVEFAQVYKYGNGINGGGGQYYLYSGTVNSVEVPVGNDIMLINHTHPGGTAYPSSADKALLGRYQQFGSPQISSEIIPIGKGNIRFNINGLIGAD